MTLEGSATAQQPLGPSGKIAGTAIVVLTHEFCTAEVRTGNSIVGHNIFRPGPELCARAEEAARNSFESVIRMETAPKPADTGGHLVLVPRFADMEAATHFIGGDVALLLEWSAIDPSGKILWVQTIELDAKTNVKSNKKTVERLLQDMTTKSAEAIRGSQEIRRFVETLPAK
jgi:hypothetical protein